MRAERPTPRAPRELLWLVIGIVMLWFSFATVVLVTGGKLVQSGVEYFAAATSRDPQSSTGAP